MYLLEVHPTYGLEGLGECYPPARAGMSPDVRFPKLSVDHFREASKEIDGSLVGGGLGRNVRFRGSFFLLFSFFEVKEGGLLCDFHRERKRVVAAS